MFFIRNYGEESAFMGIKECGITLSQGHKVRRKILQLIFLIFMKQNKHRNKWEAILDLKQKVYILAIWTWFDHKPN